MHTRTKPRWLIGAAALLLLTPWVAADDGAEAEKNLAKLLVEKRAAVEKLAAKLDLEKAATGDALRSLAMQKADLERKLKSQDAEGKELAELRAKVEAEVERKRAGRRALAPIVTQQIAAARAYVAQGIPFKRAQRLADLEALDEALAKGEVEADDALSRLWSTLEDELRLTRENGKHRQTIEVDGLTQLADVVKLGTVLMYFRTQDGRVGVVEPVGDDWRYRALQGDGAEQVRTLFEALDKHIRQGLFLLPNPHATSRDPS